MKAQGPTRLIRLGSDTRGTSHRLSALYGFAALFEMLARPRSGAMHWFIWCRVVDLMTSTAFQTLYTSFHCLIKLVNWTACSYWATRWGNVLHAKYAFPLLLFYIRLILLMSFWGQWSLNLSIFWNYVCKWSIIYCTDKHKIMTTLNLVCRSKFCETKCASNVYTSLIVCDEALLLALVGWFWMRTCGSAVDDSRTTGRIWRGLIFFTDYHDMMTVLTNM